MNKREHEGNFWVDDNVLFLDVGAGYTDMFICENFSYTFKISI